MHTYKYFFKLYSMLVELSQHAKKHNRIESESDKTFGEHPTFGKKLCGTESAQHWRRHGEEKTREVKRAEAT